LPTMTIPFSHRSPSPATQSRMANPAALSNAFCLLLKSFDRQYCLLKKRPRALTSRLQTECRVKRANGNTVLDEDPSPWLPNLDDDTPVNRWEAIQNFENMLTDLEWSAGRALQRGIHASHGKSKTLRAPLKICRCRRLPGDTHIRKIGRVAHQAASSYEFTLSVDRRQ